MTATPVPDFAAASKVAYRLITKATDDRPTVGKHFKGAAPSGKKPGFVAKGLAKGTVALNNGQMPGQLHTEISIKAEPGTNLYLIALDPSTQTRFGPGRYPIQLLPLDYTELFLQDVGLIYVDGAGTELFVAAADIPANYGSIPASAMLAFTLNRAALETAWTLGVTNSGHIDYSMKIPFFLNLYDCVSGRPVWAYGDPSVAISTSTNQSQLKVAKPVKSQAKAAQAGGGLPTPMVHGGIHPNRPTQFLY